MSVYSVCSGCQHHCVVCIVCMDYAFLTFVTLHAVRDCQLLCTVFNRVGVIDFFPSLFLLDFSSSFSPSFPSGHLVSIVCLPDQGSHFSFNSRICVDLSFVIILPQAFVFSFFLGLLFLIFLCRRHFISVSFSVCLALVLVFRVSVYPSSHFQVDSAWCRIFGDFLS